MKAMVACVAVAIGSAGAAPDAFRDAVSAKNPILWYRMGEPAGSSVIANDGSLGSSHDATVFGGVTLGTPGAGGDTAAAFEYATAPYLESAAVAPASMTGNPTFTAETVVFIPSSATTSDYAPFLHWGSASTGRSVFFSLRFNDRNRVFCGFYNGGLAAECTFRLDDWNHIVWLRDSAGGTNDELTGSRLFVNGVEQGLTRDTVLGGIPGVPNVSATTFRVQRSTDLVRYFDGLIDEVVLYDTLLTPEQIAEHFEALAITPYCPADLDNNCGVLDLADVNLFTQGFLAQDPIADLTGDGLFDLADVQLFVTSFLAGCP